MAKVIVASAAGKAVRIENFVGSTWADLQANSQVASLITGGVEAVVRPGNYILKDGSSLLPNSGDFNVYLIPTKNKAGMADYSNLGEEISEAISKAASLVDNNSVENLKAEIIEVIADHFGVDFSDIYTVPQGNDTEIQEAIATAQSL